ncbi:MAG: DUF1501 domain-containing protein [Parvularculaceae bacterium]|nr:DUF1501 domain-containing protein [Parvularculaceae bacterium]
MSAVTRREILRTASLLGAYGAAPFAMNLLPFNALAASTAGYKALVCVFLFGGMDNHDTVLPYDQSSYDQYAALRRTLMNEYNGLPGGSSRTRARLLALNPTNAATFGGRQFALGEALAPIHQLFNAGQAAIVGNVGPLIQPLNRTQWRSGSAQRPERLFSHNDQQSTWMAAAPEGAQFGWGGRLADMAIASRANTNASFTAVSVSGNTVYLNGQEATGFSLGLNGPTMIRAIDRPGLYNSQALPGQISDLVQDAPNARVNLLERDVAGIHRRSIALNRDLEAALSAQAPFTTTFPTSGLAQQLQAVARMIAARSTLGVSRQIYFVSTGGYDTHSNQAPSLTGLHTTLAGAMRAFYDATVELGVQNDVTAFTASDFGRTLAVNGDGTDHGWGAHHFVVGGAVNGNRILGDLPPPEVNHSQDSGSGRLIPTVAVEQFAASLAAWFGLTAGEIQSALPNIGNFSGPIDLFGAGSSV